MDHLEDIEIILKVTDPQKFVLTNRLMATRITEITDTATVLGADRVNHAYIPIDRIIQSLNSIDIGHHLTEFQSNQSLALLLGFRTRKRPKDLRQALVSLAEKRDIYLATVRVDMLLNQAVQNHLVSLISMLNLWGVAQTSLSKFWIVYHSE